MKWMIVQQTGGLTTNASTATFEQQNFASTLPRSRCQQQPLMMFLLSILSGKRFRHWKPTMVHNSSNSSHAWCFTKVFCACVRMVWNGFVEYSGLVRIIGMRNRSICLSNGKVSTVHDLRQTRPWFHVTYSARFLSDFVNGAPLPSPIRPCWSLLSRSSAMVFFSCEMDCCTAAGISESRADIAVLISFKPPATCSFALRFKRRSCDLEYGEREDSSPAGAEIISGYMGLDMLEIY